MVLERIVKQKSAYLAVLFFTNLILLIFISDIAYVVEHDD